MENDTKRRRHSAGSEDLSLSTAATETTQKTRRNNTNSDKLARLIETYHKWQGLFGPEFSPAINRSSLMDREAQATQENCTVYRTIIERLEYSTDSPPCGFTEFRGIMESLGNPQDTFETFHVTGTNGKGTVCHKIADQLKGYHVHPIGLYTSPHITSIRERFVVDGELISCLDLISLIRAVEETLGRRLRFFSMCTLVCFVWFYIKRCKVCVIEVGIGGALDPTNVIRCPACCIITSISKDHTDLLGDVDESIAKNKAGILKEKCHVILGPDISTGALKVISARARHAGVHQIIKVDAIEDDELAVERCNGKIAREAVRIFVSAKLGQHALELPINDTMPTGRLQHLLPNVLVDGGHNAMAMTAAARHLRKLNAKVYLGIAMSRKRGLLVCNPLVRALKESLMKVKYIQFDHPFRRPADKLREDMENPEVLLAPWLSNSDFDDDKSAEFEQSVLELIDDAQKGKGVVLFTGTFYFVGSVARAIRAHGSFFTKHTFC